MKNLKGRYVHCETIEQAKELMKEAVRQGFRPVYPSDLQFYIGNTVYNFNKPNKEVWYGSRDFYEGEGRSVVEFRYMLEDKNATIEDVETLLLNYLDSLHRDELLKEKLRLSKMILNYEG